jgi:hypothetical protein
LTALNLELQQPPSLLQLVDTVSDVAKGRTLAHIRNLTLSGLGLHGPLQSNNATTTLGLAAFATVEWLDISNNPDITGMLPELLAGERGHFGSLLATLFDQMS